jgi:ChrR Cupin-like domain
MTELDPDFHIPRASWRPSAGGVRGMFEQELAFDPDTGGYTGLLRYDPGVDTTPIGPRIHDYWEEVYIISGELIDVHSEATFTAGMYVRRPPGQVHGPWRTRLGVLMLEIRRPQNGRGFSERPPT